MFIVSSFFSLTYLSSFFILVFVIFSSEVSIWFFSLFTEAVYICFRRVGSRLWKHIDAGSFKTLPHNSNVCHLRVGVHNRTVF